MLITLPLHILRELGKAMGLSILIYGFILLAIAAGQMMRDGASIFTVLVMLPYMFPLTSPMVLPLTIITGTLICYGRLAANNEYVAAQAGGIHPLWLAGPAMIVAILAACITVFLNADVLDQATRGIERAILSDTAGILQRRLSKPGSVYLQNRVLCRMRTEHGRAGVDITEFAQGADKVKPGQTPRWDPAYPHQVRRIIARNHAITRVEDEGGELRVGIRLEDFNAFDLTSRRLQPFFGRVGNPTWPAGRSHDINISSRRLKYTGFLRLIRMRNDLLRDLAILDASLLQVDDIRDWQAFCRRLDQRNRAGGYETLWQLWNVLTPAAHRALAKGVAGGLNTRERETILHDLNRVLLNIAMFQPQHFNLPALGDELKQLIEQRKQGKLSVITACRMNRLFLEAAFPDTLLPAAPTPAARAATADHAGEPQAHAQGEAAQPQQADGGDPRQARPELLLLLLRPRRRPPGAALPQGHLHDGFRHRHRHGPRLLPHHLRHAGPGPRGLHGALRHLAA